MQSLVNSSGTPNQQSFFYIGSNQTYADQLISIFSFGQVVADPHTARLELVKCLGEGQEAVPKIIFCDPASATGHLENLLRFIKSHHQLTVIPVIVIGCGLEKNELEYWRKAQLSDDIVFLSEVDEKNLLTKINFYQKIGKNKRALARRHSNMQQAMQIIPVHTGVLMKRLFDILFALTAILLLSPVFLFIMLAILIESKGPFLYISKRAGQGYRVFNFYKFRTMVCGADQLLGKVAHLNQYSEKNSSGALFYKIQNDPRITPLGAFLRNTSLDELPQLFNVLKGDMSLVGNRPLPLYEAESLTTDEWAKRFLAPAGITGLWQIKKRGKSDMSVEERIMLDINYAEKSSFLYDFWIMANTPTVLLQRVNA